MRKEHMKFIEPASIADTKIAAQQAFFNTRMKAILIVAVLVAILLIVPVYAWGKSPVPCKYAFPMWVGCTLGRYETAPLPHLNKTELRCFAPAQPTIFTNASIDLAFLGADAPLRLVQFHNGLSALRRDIHDIADGMTNYSATSPQIRQVAKRFFLTLRPGLDALLALAPIVPRADQVERAAIDLYDAGRPDRPPPEGTLRDRINRLLQIKSSETSQGPSA
jgi:hypothetical protein